MQLKNIKYFIVISLLVAFTSSCSTIKSIGNSTKKWSKAGLAQLSQPIKKVNAIPTNIEKLETIKPAIGIEHTASSPIKFLENIAVKPGKIYISKISDSIEAEPSPLMGNDHFEKMPDNLSDIEKANWLQLKYSIKMDVAVEEINNIPLLQKIDEWWGTPYCLGGNSKGCIDCSFFTLDVMKSTYNINLKRTAAEQYEQTEKIDWVDLKEGDLIFFKTEGRKNITHVGIYLTNNKFAHASTSQGVTISDLTESYWQKRLYSLGRVSATIAQ